MIDDSGARGLALVEAARAAATGNPDGRLAVPDLASWDIFPFEGDMRVKRIDDVQVPEPARAGAGGLDCRACDPPDSTVIWTNGTFQVRAPDVADPVLSIVLEPREHLDLANVDEVLAADLGILVVRIARAMENLPGVARVHVNRWGDGAEHLHVWFFARPTGVLQLRGSCLPDWLDILPAMSEDQRTEDLTALVAGLNHQAQADRST